MHETNLPNDAARFVQERERVGAERARAPKLSAVKSGPPRGAHGDAEHERIVRALGSVDRPGNKGFPRFAAARDVRGFDAERARNRAKIAGREREQQAAHVIVDGAHRVDEHETHRRNPTRFDFAKLFRGCGALFERSSAKKKSRAPIEHRPSDARRRCGKADGGEHVAQNGLAFVDSSAEKKLFGRAPPEIDRFAVLCVLGGGEKSASRFGAATRGAERVATFCLNGAKLGGGGGASSSVHA